MLPSTEARIAAQENFTIMLNARIEQLSQDMKTNFRELKQEIKDNFIEVKQDIKVVDDGIKASYISIGDTFIAFGETTASKEDIARVEATMATKEDVGKLEARFDNLGARFDNLGARFDKMEARFDKMEATQDLILQLLQQK